MLKNKSIKSTMSKYSKRSGERNRKLLLNSRTIKGYEAVLSGDICLDTNSCDLITIVVTNYNKRKMLINCVRSAMSQSYRNIEVIVIDDNSRDNVIKMLKPFSDHRLRVVTNDENYGPYACRNYALEIARGKYVTFLDADDTIDKNHILFLLSCIRSRGLIGALTLYNRYSTSGRLVKGPNVCEASIMFNRIEVLNSIGYYHMVRCGGDTEFRERMAKHYGRSKMGIFYHTTYTALYSEKSLTRSTRLGGGTKVRQEYAGAFRRWHKQSSNLFFDHRTMDMPFDLGKDIKVIGFDKKSFTEVKL